MVAITGFMAKILALSFFIYDFDKNYAGAF
jgi:hypothetical protein